MGNDTSKYKMQSSDINSLTSGMQNMNVNVDIDSLTSGMQNMNVDVYIQPWIRDMPTNHLQATIRELAEDMNTSLNSTFSSEEIVTEDNRQFYEYNLALFLTNAQRQFDMDGPDNIEMNVTPSRDDIMRKTKKELLDVCREYDIRGCHGKNKSTLLRHILDFFNF